MFAERSSGLVQLTQRALRYTEPMPDCFSRISHATVASGGLDMWNFIKSRCRRGKWHVAFLAVLLWPVCRMLGKMQGMAERMAQEPRKLTEEEGRALYEREQAYRFQRWTEGGDDDDA